MTSRKLIRAKSVTRATWKKKTRLQLIDEITERYMIPALVDAMLYRNPFISRLWNDRRAEDEVS